VVIERIAEEGEQVVIGAVIAAGAGACPACGRESTRIHSRYTRALADLPACGRPVRVRLAVRRFRCVNPDCARRTFVEQVAGVTRPHGRTIGRLEAVLAAFCVALGGEAGARLAGHIGVTVGGDALLRLLRRDAVPACTPRVLGVDDWAWRRGERYGSVLVDLEAGRPVDLLPERTSAALEAWLQGHPGVEVIVRDRATEYARGAARGAPQAVQVVDRWHVLKNAREVAERLLDRRAQDVRGLTLEGAGAGRSRRRRSAAEEARRAAVHAAVAARHAEIQRLTAAGETILGIARRLGITRTMVRRYRFADAPPVRDDARRASALDPHDAYLRRRWAAGCRNALQLWREIRERGYRGTSRQVSRWAQERRTAPAPSTPRRHLTGEAGTPPVALPPRHPSVRQLAWLLVRDPGGLADADLRLLDRLREACAPAATAYPLLQEFVGLVRERAAARLDPWLDAASACGVPDLATFAAGLRQERAALLAALTLPWTTSPVEGHITRLKLLKRQGYGRCSLDTLKRRFLHAA
jgi:transposase